LLALPEAERTTGKQTAGRSAENGIEPRSASWRIVVAGREEERGPRSEPVAIVESSRSPS
jgi:hypothetical protein